jgi:hypothetical protein
MSDNNRKPEPKLEPETCAPHKQYIDGSCFTLDNLIKITQKYNEHIKDKDISEIPMIYEKKYLVKSLTERLSNVCNNQLCWLKQEFMQNILDDDITKHTFRPEGPATNLKWLNTKDINSVIEQYYKKYSDFRFFGAVPIDFDDLPVLGIKSLKYDNLLNNKVNRIGFVFNLDEHYKSGSHWVALYVNLQKKQIYFFDSYGIKPDKRIKKLMKRIKKSMKEMANANKSEIDLRYNKHRHQFKNSECGVYSINFILRLLKGETFDEITKHITKDDEVSKCRRIYFNKDR